MYDIRELSDNERDLSLDYISRLLAELRDEEDSATNLDRDKIMSDWADASNRHRVFAAFDGDEILGVISLSECFAVFAGGNYGIINELYVVPEHRSKGVGRLLIEQVVSVANENGWRRLDVTAPLGEKWRRTVSFYIREGFLHTGPKLKKLL